MPSEAPSQSAENPIWSLEKLKDRIIALFSASTLDDATKNMWCDDAKGMYYRVMSADAIAGSGDPDAVRGWLHGASSRFEKVASELRALRQDGEELETELRQTFATCHRMIASRIPDIPTPATAPSRVIRNSAEDYILPCSVCGKKAVAVHPAGSEEKILKGIICAGITRAIGIDVQHRDKIFVWLENGDLAAFHHFMEIDEDVDGGVDAYCPNCDKIYCRTHYNVIEQFDDGFYDCAYGTCPQGHRRKIDD
ncbi:MAG TPA: hypothetical protein VJA94_16125 [Candidatus Angelobacter sp.]